MNIFKSIKKSKSGFIVYGIIAIVFIYMLFLFFYLKVVGIYGVAVIKEGVATSEGIDFKYDFFYEGEVYTGGFTGVGKYEIGSKYFVLFSRNNPDKNLLQYSTPVPDCFKDSTNTFWFALPKCQ